LRRAALEIVRSMPNNEMIEQYEMTAGALTQWLVQWEGEPTESTYMASGATVPLGRERKSMGVE
jgi:hypothetical protein